MANGDTDYIQVMLELFRSNPTAYAVKRMVDVDKKVFFPARDESGADLPLTAEVINKHLTGEISIGAYAFVSDTTVRWFVVDFDGKKGNALQDALIVKQNLQRAGIPSWMERSQSGKGVHLWLFFEDEIDVKIVLDVISLYVPEYFVAKRNRETSYDLTIPDSVKRAGKYGRLCALPLNGKELVKAGRTAFIAEDGQPVEKQNLVLKEAYDTRIGRETFQALHRQLESIQGFKNRATAVEKESPGTVPGGVKIFSPFGCKWLHGAYTNPDDVSEEEWHAALGQFVPLENGRELAHMFSKPYSGYSHDETDGKFDRAVAANLPMRTHIVQEKFNRPCGNRCVCKEMGCHHPWELAKIPITRLSEWFKRGRVYGSRELADVAIKTARSIAEGNRLGHPWGYDVLDDHTELRPKNFIVIAARRSVGKTAIMIDTSYRMASRGIPQYIFSIEMSHDQIALRYLARISEISYTTITTGELTKEQWEKITDAHAELSKLPIYIEEFTKHPERMLDVASELVYKHGKGCVWIDYLQMAHRVAGEKQKDAVDRAVASYIAMDKLLEVPVITLAQLSRSEELSESETELDSWLKDSGNIEQDADVIHYVRGRLGPGPLVRKWRIHKERFRASGVDLKFEFYPEIYKFNPIGSWSEDDVEEGAMSYELGLGFEKIPS